MVTAAASERGAGSDPVTRAVPAPENAWTMPTVTGDPPPKTSARPPEVTPAASCSPPRSAPIRRAAPVAVRSAYTPLADVQAGVSPPSTMSWPGDPGTTTARLSGAARCHGSKPDSAASRTGGAAAARTGGRRGPVRAGAAVRQDREPRDNGDDDHGHRRHDGTPAAHARRHPAPPGTRLRPSPLTRGCWHRLIMP